VARRRRNPEIIAGRVNADGSIAAGDGFTVQKTGTGAYTVTLASGFRMLGAIVSPYATYGVVWQASATERSFVVSTVIANTGASSDMPFNIVAVGVQQ
jgi:hypothetical protein